MESKGEEVACYVTGGVGALDVSRETELAVENFMLAKELARLEKSQTLLQGQNARCETALKKMNHLIDEYVRRARVYDRKLKISQQTCEEQGKKLDMVSSERRQMARTFGKHREARERIQGEFLELEDQFRVYRKEQETLDEGRRAEIASLTAALSTSLNQHTMDAADAAERDSTNAATIAGHVATIAARDEALAALRVELAEAVKIKDHCLNNVEKTAPYQKLAKYSTSLNTKLLVMTTKAAKLTDQVDHLVAENDRMVAFAAAEGLEIPGMSALPHGDDDLAVSL
jgi:chromosome segregation ATPase